MVETGTEGRGLPLLAPMSEIAGRAAPIVGAAYLAAHRGGSGVLLGGAPGVQPGRVTVIGAGNVGWNSAWIAAGMEAESLRSRIRVPMPPRLFRPVLDRLETEKRVVREQAIVRLPTHRVELGGDVLARAGGGAGPVPGASVRVGAGVGGLGALGSSDPDTVGMAYQPGHIEREDHGGGGGGGGGLGKRPRPRRARRRGRAGHGRMRG